MSWLKEFREFAVKGNAIDLAAGITIGAAFGKIVSSLVADIVMPPIGLLLGGVDFSNLFVTLRGEGAYPSLAAAKEAGAVTLNYGVFLQALVDFIIIAFSIFLIVKLINAAQRRSEEKQQEEPKPAADIVLLTEIRDLL